MSLHRSCGSSVVCYGQRITDHGIVRNRLHMSETMTNSSGQLVCEGCFGHCTIHALPIPRNLQQLIILPAIPAPAGKWLRARGDSLSFRKLHYQISGLSGPVRNFFSPVFTFRWPSPHGLRMLSLREQETVTTTTESSPAGPQTDQGAQTPERGCTPRSRSQVLRASG